jgi:hypothetical protein
MTETVKRARSILEDKFWIVESQGKKIGTIQRIDETPGEVVFVHDQVRERFPSVRVLSSSHSIELVDDSDKPAGSANEIYGYPCSTTAHDPIYDVVNRLPLYNKRPGSKSQYCAGYYAICYNGTWTREFCPKKITLNRNPYRGPFKTDAEARAAAK